MGLGKQAKTLSKGQVEAVLGYLANTRWPTRNRVIFLLSAKAGLRAKEIASLTWRMVTDARGQIGHAIHLENTASKGQSGRVIPMNDDLRTALVAYAKTTVIATSGFLIESERSNRMSAQAVVNLFWRWYQDIGFDGCSSHSGRRTFITNSCTEDFDSRGLVARRPDARWSLEPSYHATIHRGQSGSADEDRGACLKRHDLRCFTYGEPRLALSATEVCSSSRTGHIVYRRALQLKAIDRRISP